MRFLQYIPPALLLDYAAASADESSVISLTGVSFDHVVNVQPVMPVAFVSSRSIDCEALAPEYEKAAKLLGDNMGIALGTVDCVDDADLCARYRVEDFPLTHGTAGNTDPGHCASLVVLRHGTSIASYEGPLRADKIFSFMLTLPIPAVIEVTATNHDAVKASADVVFISYMSSPTETSATVFDEVAERHHYDKLVFGLCIDEAAIAAARVDPPAVVAYRKFDAEPPVLSSPADFTARVLKTFVSKHSLPLVGDVAALGYHHYRRAGLPLAILFIECDDPVHAHYLATLRSVAEKYRGRLTFGYTASRLLAKVFGLSDDGPWPVLAIQDRNGVLQAIAQGPYVSTETLINFVDRFLTRTEPAVPASQSTSVYEVVGSEFAQVVFDDAKDIFLEVYATHGCPHCKRLKPTWEMLGNKYAGLKDRITIARVEATSNDLPFSVTAVPWLRFEKAGTREFIDFQGERSLELLVEFVETHAANSLASSDVAESSAEDAQREFHSNKS